MKKMPFHSVRIMAAVLISASVFATAAQALSVKADPLAAKGCIPKISKEESLTVMRRYHMHSRGAKDMEIRTLGTALIYVEKLNGGKPLKRASAQKEDNYSFTFRDAIRNSHQAENEIRVNRNGKKQYGQNVAQLVHELGHYIGNNGGYEAYYDAVGHHYCKVSDYSDNNSHEQFAEVFAAFVTRPGLLKHSDSITCRRAFHFFATKIFPPTSAAIALRCMARQDAILKGLKPPPEKPEKPQISTPIKPAAEAKPANAKPANAKPANAKPANAKPAPEEPATEKPAAVKPANGQPVATPTPKTFARGGCRERGFRAEIGERGGRA